MRSRQAPLRPLGAASRWRARTSVTPRRAALAAALAAALLAPMSAQSAGLAEDLRDALANDPRWRSAQAARDAGIEAEVQGRAGLLPQVSFTGSKSKASTDATTQTAQGPQDYSRDYDAFNYALQLRQPLLRPRAWAAYSQGKAQAAYAEANLRAARQDLAQRVVLAYAEWGYANASVQASQSQVASLELSASGARRVFEAGDGTRTDVETARARLAQAQAQRVEAEGQVQSAILGWRQLTGREALRTAPVIGTGSALRLPLDPATLAGWRDLALASNGQIQGLRHAVDAARDEIRKTRSDHLPTLDLFASRTRSQSDTEQTIGNRYDTTRLGLQLSVPIYAGGSVSSTMRQAAAELRRAESDLDAASQQLALQVERDWHTLQSARETARASMQSIDAAALAARAARLGLAAGSATRIDELDAIAQEAAARRDLIQADARALVAWARLMAATDRLDEEALQRADAVMEAVVVKVGGPPRN